MSADGRLFHLEESGEGKAVENCVPFSSASPSAGPSAIGASPAAERFHGRHIAPSKKASPTPIITAVIWAAAMPEAPRSQRRHDRDHVPSEHAPNKSASQVTPEAPCAARDFSAIIKRTIAPRVGSLRRRMREHDVPLQRREIARVDADGRELSKTGVDAIDRLALCNYRGDEIGGRHDTRAAGGIECNLGAAIDSSPIRERHGAGRQGYCAHLPLRTRMCSGLKPRR